MWVCIGALFRGSIDNDVAEGFVEGPERQDRQQARVRALAQAILDARALLPEAALADLYDADVMVPELRSAHRALDAAIDRL